MSGCRIPWEGPIHRLIHAATHGDRPEVSMVAVFRHFTSCRSPVGHGDRRRHFRPFPQRLVAMVQTDTIPNCSRRTLSHWVIRSLHWGPRPIRRRIPFDDACFFQGASVPCGLGSVILGMHHDQDIRNMGGLGKYMPWTYATALIGSLALVGVPFFSGFYSKESIINAIRVSSVTGATVALIAVGIGLFVTGFYTFRLFFYVFHGRERFQRQQLVNLKTAEKEKVPQGNLIGLLPGEKPHESPWSFVFLSCFWPFPRSLSVIWQSKPCFTALFSTK